MCSSLLSERGRNERRQVPIRTADEGTTAPLTGHLRRDGSMIPSLVAGEVKLALVDYLATTFGLSDDDVREELSDFLGDPTTGIFRGPYLRVRAPFRAVESDWVSPLGWLPDWFAPYVHQATSFERLTTLAGHAPQPTLVTTGTGSGKTECFMMPVLDHCARARDVGQRGIKAVILYPMNALASDQAGRL